VPTIYFFGRIINILLTLVIHGKNDFDERSKILAGYRSENLLDTDLKITVGSK